MAYTLASIATTGSNIGNYHIPLTGLGASGCVIDHVDAGCSLNLTQSPASTAAAPNQDNTQGYASIRMILNSPGLAVQLQRGDDGATNLSHFAAYIVPAIDNARVNAVGDADDGVMA
jgi:hypothetical protein